MVVGFGWSRVIRHVFCIRYSTNTSEVRAQACFDGFGKVPVESRICRTALSVDIFVVFSMVILPNWVSAHNLLLYRVW